MESKRHCDVSDGARRKSVTDSSETTRLPNGERRVGGSLTDKIVAPIGDTGGDATPWRLHTRAPRELQGGGVDAGSTRANTTVSHTR